jgi:hypothetical protein
VIGCPSKQASEAVERSDNNHEPDMLSLNNNLQPLLPCLACLQGYRYAMPHSILMMHHPSGAARGQASEMHIESRELVSESAGKQGHGQIIICVLVHPMLATSWYAATRRAVATQATCRPCGYASPCLALILGLCYPTCVSYGCLVHSPPRPLTQYHTAGSSPTH